MKKSQIRSLIWAALTIISLASYTYLGKFSPEAETTYAQEQDLKENLNEEKDSKVFFPDIALVKKLLNITKIVMPND